MMAEKNRKNVIKLEEIRGDRFPLLLERRAVKALDRLCDALSSPAAKSTGLSENEIINAIKKLKPSLDQPEDWCQYTPVWNLYSKQQLKQVGLDLKEIEGLASILPFGKNSRKINVSDQLIPEIIFTLKILDCDEDKFRQFLSGLENIPAVGVLLCEILTDTKFLEKSRQFLDRESTDQKREILMEYLKRKLLYLDNINIAHFASLCGQYIATIVPKEINCIKFWLIKVSESNAIALATVINHSSVVKELIFFDSGLDSKSIASLQDGLKNSDVKICSLDISYNRDIDEGGFRCLGNIVKKHAVQELKICGCDVSFIKLKAFDSASGNAKIRSLDISWNNDNIDEEVFRCLGNIVKKHAVEELDMSSCDLSFGKLKSFDKTSGIAKIRSLNITWNQSIDQEGFRCLGNILKKHAVENLNMSSCGLSFGKLKSFNKTSGNANICSLNISCNENIDEEGFCCFGNIVKKHAVKELNMSKCGLSFEKMKSFDDASGDAKIKVLDISYNDEYLTVNAIYQLAPKVTESMIAKRYWYSVWSEQDIRELQDFIQSHHSGGPKVTLGDGLPELGSEAKTSSRLSGTVVVDEDSHVEGDARIVADGTPSKKHSAVKGGNVSAKLKSKKEGSKPAE